MNCFNAISKVCVFQDLLLNIKGLMCPCISFRVLNITQNSLFEEQYADITQIQ